MFDTVNFWIDRAFISGSSFDALPYLSEITERQNEKGYSCTGKVLDYTVSVYESGISLKGSLAKSFFTDNIQTLTRRTTQEATKQLGDCLHMDIREAKVTRVDVSTIIPTKRPPSDYYPFFGNKPYFTRLQASPYTLYYNNHQRQIVLYDKVKEANTKDMQIPDILNQSSLLRYELRYTKYLNKQLKNKVTAGLLSNEIFYQSVIMNWYNEFKTIQKLKNQSFMIDNITTVREAETALFSHLLQQGGQSVIDEYLNELKAKGTFKDRKYYSRLKADLNNMLVAPRGKQTDLMQELETAIYNVAKYAR
jgi:hypothetical protein